MRATVRGGTPDIQTQSKKSHNFNRSSQMKTEAATVWPLLQAEQVATTILLNTFFMLRHLLKRFLLQPSKARRGAEAMGNTMRAQLKKINVNPLPSVIAQGLGLLPNLFRVPLLEAVLYEFHAFLFLNYHSASLTSPGKLPKVKQFNSVCLIWCLLFIQCFVPDNCILHIIKANIKKHLQFDKPGADITN